MENKSLEQLFQRKLENLMIEPSNAAKYAFARKIKIMRQKIIIKRISIAASITLIILAGMWIYPFKDQVPTGILTEKESLTIPLEEKSPMVNESSFSENLGDESGINMDDQSPEKMLADKSVDGKEIIEPVEMPSEQIPQIQQETWNEVDTAEPNSVSIVTDEMVAQHVDENAYIEYNIEEPATTAREVEEASYEPVKITIEYIASGNNDDKLTSKFKEFSSKMDNVKGMDEIIGDLRTYKDRLFALDFKNEDKVKNEK